MIWEEYRRNFMKAAVEKGRNSEYIEKNLAYAFQLYSQGLPIVYDQTHFSYLVGYNIEYLLKVSNSQRNFYRSFKIKKKNGGYRNISEPLPNLKFIQKWILEEILYCCKTNNFAKAYKRNVSLKDNAKFHRGQKKVLTIDIENFFGTIKSSSVYNFFSSLGYSENIVTMLTNICTLGGSLPQGASTSPALSNLLMRDIDKRIAAFCTKNKIRYTRYADDLTFSGDFQEGMIIKFVTEILKAEGFQLNEKKTRVRLQHQRQEVTGIIVNEKMQVSAEVRKELRKNVYYIRKYGLDSHLEIIKKDKRQYLKHLLGMANHICFVNPKDNKAHAYLNYLKNLWEIEQKNAH
ncbi:retron St85 family RNA-directed DNA polymerase [Bacillus badius]|uniref:retron St85 family RNA-directed DNA polymerase n=1 Tax=Bacillus badius TaxID=1455 RepID=UPI002E1B13C2|nr:retron St85 family RNA-directed DNA polymerase [Bacillus badius]MED0666648.1 retron St85 family RNA-directed DNA polymerase [Bacillus badius]